MAETTGDKPAKKRPALPGSQEQAEIETLFQSIGEGILATDQYGHITRVNKAACEILGYSQRQLVGRWFNEAIVASYDDGTPIEAMERPATRAILSGKTVTARTTYRRKDGSMVPVSVTVSPIIHLYKPVGAIEIFRDISQDILTDKMKTDFISVASHQLRTPLSAINVYTHMLNDGMAGKLNDEQASFAASILTSVERMNSLINTLLNITRIEAGGINVQLSPIRLYELVNDIITEITPQAQAKHLRFLHRIATNAPELVTDSLLVKEVIANILSNAIKYTPEDGTVTVKLKVDGNNIIFSVQDTGFGIPLSAQPHIFTKFFRAENILTEDVSGTGLGLYLTKTIADSLNGELWFESRENVGTTFYFSLPLQGSVARTGRFKLES